MTNKYLEKIAGFFSNRKYKESIFHIDNHIIHGSDMKYVPEKYMTSKIKSEPYDPVKHNSKLSIHVPGPSHKLNFVKEKDFDPKGKHKIIKSRAKYD